MFKLDEGADSLEIAVGKMLQKSNNTIACAESCTGGLLMGRLTAVPGSSAYVQGGIVSYSNQVKIEQLGVESKVLDTVGAVSSQVAVQMAQGVLHHLTHTRTSSFFFLPVYYARVTEFLHSQPSPLQRSIDAG